MTKKRDQYDKTVLDVDIQADGRESVGAAKLKSKGHYWDNDLYFYEEFKLY